METVKSAAEYIAEIERLIAELKQKAGVMRMMAEEIMRLNEPPAAVQG